MKIICCDYDGTLFQENGIGVSQADRDAIIKFRTQGGKFGIVTGRDLTASYEVLENLRGIIDFLICSTGSVICDENGRIVNQSKSCNVRSISEIADEALKNNVKWFTVIDETTRYPLDTSGKSSHNYTLPNEFNNCTIWFHTIEDAMSLEKYIKDNHSGSFTFYRNFECIEITPLGVNKASAVRELAGQFENPMVFTVGDGATDVSMVKEFYGFALENSVDDVKNVAKKQCNRVCDMIEIILNI